MGGGCGGVIEDVLCFSQSIVASWARSGGVLYVGCMDCWGGLRDIVAKR